MKKVVTFGEIMLRLAPPGYLRFSQTNSFDVIYGGGESNVGDVSVAIARYRRPCLAYISLHFLGIKKRRYQTPFFYS